MLIQTNLIVSLKVQLIQDFQGVTNQINPIVNTIQIDLRRPLVAVAFINIGQQQRSPPSSVILAPNDDSSASLDSAAAFSDNGDKFQRDSSTVKFS